MMSFKVMVDGKLERLKQLIDKEVILFGASARYENIVHNMKILDEVVLGERK